MVCGGSRVSVNGALSGSVVRLYFCLSVIDIDA